MEYVAALMKVSPAAFAKYSWTSRTIKYHRAQIRKEFGTRPAGEADEERWAVWLAAEVCPVETTARRLTAALRQRCRTEQIEPPAEGQVERVVASALHRFEDAFAAGVAARLGPTAPGAAMTAATPMSPHRAPDRPAGRRAVPHPRPPARRPPAAHAREDPRVLPASWGAGAKCPEITP